jgi:hypothetical protein
MMIENLCLVLLMSLPPEPGADGARDAAITLARETVAREAGVAAGEMEVVEATAVDWPDAGLGCRQKGMMYAQMITPGHRVRLRAGEKTYDVHVGNGRAVLCPDASRAEEHSYVGAAANVSAASRRDLAQRLKVPESAIEVVFARPTVWPDSDLGCPGSGAAPTPGETKGFLIELRHEGRPYRYHSDMSRVRPCE